MPQARPGVGAESGGPRPLTRDRHLAWDACVNVRDLGGLSAAGGRRTRWGALVRSDLLCRLTPAGRDALRAHGVRTVVDIRGLPELADEPSPFASDAVPGVRLVHAPMGDDAEATTRIRAAETPAEQYRLSLDLNRERIARIASEIARAPEGGVVIYCHAGKDRTGIVIGLLLALVGVPEDVIAADYALSGPNLAPLNEAWLDRHARDAAQRAQLAAFTDAGAATMLATLDHLRTRHGGAESYLAAGGVGATQIDVIRARLLD